MQPTRDGGHKCGFQVLDGGVAQTVGVRRHGRNAVATRQQVRHGSKVRDRGPHTTPPSKPGAPRGQAVPATVKRLGNQRPAFLRPGSYRDL